MSGAQGTRVRDIRRQLLHVDGSRKRLRDAILRRDVETIRWISRSLDRSVRVVSAFNPTPYPEMSDGTGSRLGLPFTHRPACQRPE